MTDVIVDQADWGKLRVTGADRKRFLQGMITNDLEAVPLWAFVRAAVLTPKGRVVALTDVVDEGDSYLLLSEPACADKLHKMLVKHAIMDDVTFTPVEMACHRVWGDPWTAPPVFQPLPPGPAASREEVEVRRIEAGLPRYGADVTEDHFPFEANLDSAISYTKGCYVGQEVVARANARGHANKRLVGLRLSGDGPVAPGTRISAAIRPEAGTITSSIVSRFGPIALGYVHRSVWEPGTEVEVGGRAATVSALPFAG